MGTQGTILVVLLGDFSFTNHSVRDQIIEKFDDHHVEVVDLVDVFREHPITMGINALHMLRDYNGKKRGWSAFASTRYANDKIKAWMREKVTAGNYRFTFQTQSIFDAGTPGIPHFMYTDHTALTNLYYPGFDRRNLRPHDFLERERGMYASADRIFTFSTHVSRSLIDLYHCPPEKVIRVGAGTNFKFEPTEPDNDNYSNKRLLFVGVDWERKGGPHLVESFKQVREKHPDATLTVVGCSPNVNQPGVEIVGRVPREEVGRYYEQASVFCMPTTREPFGIVFLEAMYKKLPVVATDIGAIPDLITDGENGFTVPTGDVDGLAQHIITLLDSPSMCRAFGKRGYQVASQEYSWDTVGRRFRKHIDAYLAQHATR